MNVFVDFEQLKEEYEEFRNYLRMKMDEGSVKVYGNKNSD